MLFLKLASLHVMRGKGTSVHELFPLSKLSVREVLAISLYTFYIDDLWSGLSINVSWDLDIISSCRTVIPSVAIPSN